MCLMVSTHPRSLIADNSLFVKSTGKANTKRITHTYLIRKNGWSITHQTSVHHSQRYKGNSKEDQT